MAAPRDMLVSAGKAAGVSLAAAALAAQAAGAVTIKMGGDTGALVFEPSNVKIKAGESVTWTNNAGFPHNVVFDEDEIPVRRLFFGGIIYKQTGLSIQACQHTAQLAPLGQWPSIFLAQ